MVNFQQQEECNSDVVCHNVKNVEYTLLTRFQVANGREWVNTNIPQAAAARNGHWHAKWQANADRLVLISPFKSTVLWWLIDHKNMNDVLPYGVNFTLTKPLFPTLILMSALSGTFLLTSFIILNFE